MKYLWDRANVRIMHWGIVVLLAGALARAQAQSENSAAEIERPAPRICRKGEVWNDCGSSCPKSCDNRDNTCLMCTMQCVPGCYCAGTTIRGPNNTCVEPRNCPKRTCTGSNEIFDPCPPTCPRGERCENLWSKIPCTPIDCCEPQCRCKPGYFRNDQNKCVSANECTPCPEGEVRNTCGSACPITCANINNPPTCTLQCVDGCFCPEGTYRNKAGKCTADCSPPECGKGEVYSECGSSCPPSCENKDNTCLVCTAQCVRGCFCAKGTIRGPNNTCVEPEKCPLPQCGANEEFDKCPPTCPRTQECKILWSRPEPCTPIDCCHPQCRCKSGFYRKNGVCVSAEECSSSTTRNDAAPEEG